jgi:alkanesulfonate monooxygenase SsuD/methylene tetrahydromethanopterin reductase-like flavin-dependent oxidoreductase (luciferase family)
MVRPVRFGVGRLETALGPARCELARRAAALGYATRLVPDSCRNPLTPVPALMAAAAFTTTLRSDYTVFANGMHHPALLEASLAVAGHLAVV